MFTLKLLRMVYAIPSSSSNIEIIIISGLTTLLFSSLASITAFSKTLLSSGVYKTNLLFLLPTPTKLTNFSLNLSYVTLCFFSISFNLLFFNIDKKRCSLPT